MASEELQKFKVIFLGDQGVGKSSILNRFVQDKFESEYQATIGLDFHSKNVTINNATVRLLLYDTAGQEKFKALIPMYIRDANIIIMVYDITNPDTLEHTNHWINETKDLKRDDSIFVLIGNKNDLTNERKVSEEQGKKFAENKGLIFMEVSAKTGKNIIELFQDGIYPEMIKKFNISGEEEQGNNNQGDNTKNIEIKDIKVTKKKGCCGGKKEK